MEGTSHQIEPIVEEQIPAAGALLAEAFFTDPLMVALFPQAGERRRILAWYYTATVRTLAPLQSVYATAGTVNGVAVWDPPGTTEEAPAWPEAAGAPAYDRFLKAIDFLAPLRQAALPGPFWYLSWIGVAATHQRQGLGSALLAPVLARADRENLPCYLETFDRPNLLFYGRHGFEVVVSEIEPASGMRFWTMQRTPR